MCINSYIVLVSSISPLYLETTLTTADPFPRARKERLAKGLVDGGTRLRPASRPWLIWVIFVTGEAYSVQPATQARLQSS